MALHRRLAFLLGIACCAFGAAASEQDEWLRQAEAELAAGRAAEAVLLLQRGLPPGEPMPQAEALLSRLEAALGADALAPLRAAAAGAGTTPGRPANSRFWLGIEAGRDSNINSGSDANAVSIPALDNRSQPLTSPLLTRMSSSFVGARAGTAVPLALSPRTRLWLRAEGAWRVHAAATAYLPHRYDLSAGLRHDGDRLAVGVDIYRKDQWVSRFDVVQEQGVAAEASLAVSTTFRLVGTATQHRDRYPQFLDIATRGHRTGLGLSGQWTTAGAPALLILVQAGPDRATGAVKDLDRATQTLLSLASWAPRSGQQLRIRAWHDRAAYQHTSPLFLVRRADSSSGLGAEWDIAVARGWTLTPRLAIEHARSNIDLVAFSRSQAGLELRREW